MGQPLFNAAYLTNLVSPVLFEQHPASRKERRGFATAPMPYDFRLNIKGGGGSGTFSLDFSVGIDRGEKLSGEMWRTGLDTVIDANGSRHARIIRTGSAMSKKHQDWAQKTEAYERFKSHYGISPARALTFLALFVAHDMPDLASIRALSLAGVQDHKMTQAMSSSRVRFDYTQHFQDCGFNESNDSYWLEIANEPNRFYDALSTSRNDQAGLRSQEAGGVHQLIEAVRYARYVRSGKLFELSACDQNHPAELEASISAHRQIHGKDRTTPRI